MAYIETLLGSWQGALASIGPIVSLILITLGGIVYGVAQAQPAEVKGKWQVIAIGLFVGGVVVGAIIGAAEIIRDNSMKLLT
ncbi:hypothetical protein FJZ26_00215 [Candidatus Parvarchaeota archaeon]|nr:hypothetical protein [Candidatus Parvarchaeota archaeon]